MSFVIDTVGAVTNVKVVSGIGGGCDEEAIRVIKNIPEKFIPAVQKGRPVKYTMMIPIYFSR